ncbi:uncharacterized protein LOC128671592 [Plodia interpunctella]|uniref:uncharacterized protein LOC128671592 n=1 Tax=Plodia interpunctella TaxID=58824 RepID=UPI002367DA7C|nr:uncharacterized protein LOC128671592 [Plodia interpunctella]
MENQNSIIEESIERCLLPKLAKAIDESEEHTEFDIRENKLNIHFPVLIKTLSGLDFRSDTDIASISLPKLIILDLELQSSGPWFRDKCKECSSQLNQAFDMKYGSNLCNLLESNKIFNPQLLFDNIIDDIHKKLTSKTFKNYPALIEVYCKLLNGVKNYKIKLNPLSVLPISLLLVEDYNMGNKIKGLKCCLEVLQCLTSSDFSQGNYYEVIYGSLKKCLVEKDIEVTKLTLPCLLKLLSMLPSDIKVTKTDEIYKTILDQMHTESNLYRKAVCFNFTRQMIEMHGVHCIKRKLFKSVVCDALDVCSNEAVAEIMLQDVLECLSVWLKHCWCVWRLASDQKMLSLLLKILFVTSEADTTVTVLLNLVLTMVQLCTKEEQLQICKNMESFTATHKSNQSFLNNLEIIKKGICV